MCWRGDSAQTNSAPSANAIVPRSRAAMRRRPRTPTSSRLRASSTPNSGVERPAIRISAPNKRSRFGARESGAAISSSRTEHDAHRGRHEQAGGRGERAADLDDGIGPEHRHRAESRRTARSGWSRATACGTSLVAGVQPIRPRRAPRPLLSTPHDDVPPPCRRAIRARAAHLAAARLRALRARGRGGVRGAGVRARGRGAARVSGVRALGRDGGGGRVVARPGLRDRRLRATRDRAGRAGARAARPGRPFGRRRLAHAGRGDLRQGLGRARGARGDRGRPRERRAAVHRHDEPVREGARRLRRRARPRWPRGAIRPRAPPTCASRTRRFPCRRCSGGTRATIRTRSTSTRSSPRARASARRSSPA